MLLTAMVGSAPATASVARVQIIEATYNGSLTSVEWRLRSDIKGVNVYRNGHFEDSVNSPGTVWNKQGGSKEDTYYLVAYNHDDQLSERTETVGVQVPPPWGSPRVSVRRISDTRDRLTWNKSGNAEAYNIYRNGELASSTRATSTDVISGGAAFYIVEPYKYNGGSRAKGEPTIVLASRFEEILTRDLVDQSKDEPQTREQQQVDYWANRTAEDDEEVVGLALDAVQIALRSLGSLNPRFTVIPDIAPREDFDPNVDNWFTDEDGNYPTTPTIWDVWDAIMSAEKAEDAWRESWEQWRLAEQARDRCVANSSCSLIRRALEQGHPEEVDERSPAFENDLFVDTDGDGISDAFDDDDDNDGLLDYYDGDPKVPYSTPGPVNPNRDDGDGDDDPWPSTVGPNTDPKGNEIPGHRSVGGSKGCDFHSGTTNLDDTRAMFPDRCGVAWHPEEHKCDYSSAGWHCYDN